MRNIYAKYTTCDFQNRTDDMNFVYNYRTYISPVVFNVFFFLFRWKRVYYDLIRLSYLLSVGGANRKFHINRFNCNRYSISFTAFDLNQSLKIRQARHRNQHEYENQRLGFSRNFVHLTGKETNSSLPFRVFQLFYIYLNT